MGKVDCRVCSAKILVSTSERTNGRCMPCFKDNFDFSFFDSSKEGVQEIRSAAIRYIEKHSMDVDSWMHTKIGTVHESISIMGIDHGDVVASCYLSDLNWWVATTLELIGKYNGADFKFDPKQKFDSEYGFFKGRKGSTVETMKLRTQKEVVNFNYETGKPSMAPIHYLRFWQFKYPVIADNKR